jgi:hypothetical protein
VENLTDTQAEALRGGRLSINVAPVIVVNTAANTTLQTNTGANIALGVLGGRARANLGQANLVSSLRGSR